MAPVPFTPEIPTLEEFPFQRRFFSHPNGFKQHYLDEGNGPPVIMVHGNPTWSFYYRNLVADLSKNYRCLVPDHIGMGLSCRPKADEYGFTLAERIADLGALVDSWNLDAPAHLIVHDWGGPIGLGWAVNNPDKVASVTVLNSGIRIPLDYRLPPQLSLFRFSGPLGNLLAWKANLFLWGAGTFGVVTKMSPAASRGLYAPYLRADNRLAVARFVQDIPLNPTHVSASLLAEIDSKVDALLATKPLGLVWGVRDFVFNRRVLFDWQARFPEAKTLALPEAGHFVLEDEPQHIVAWIRKFIGG